MFANFPSGSFNVVSVSSNSTASSAPVGVFNTSQPALVIIDNAVNIGGTIQVTQAMIAQIGLTIRVVLPFVVTTSDTVFLSIPPFFEYRIPVTSTDSSVVFSIPAGFAGAHALNSGNHDLYYGVIQASGNASVPNLTTITVVGQPATQPLLPVRIVNVGGNYINQLDNALGVQLTITDQAEIAAGDTWTLVYSTVGPTGTSVPISNGTVSETEPPISFTTAPNFFPALNDTPAWFWYTIARTGRPTLVSTPVQRIIDTI
ncbi:hypothetical protein EFV60_15535 [Yersinia enterocolitica]|nr:hypothetical protein [Yersinia enterocolitica]